MVNEEVTRQVVAVSERTVKLTGRNILNLIRKILQKAEKEKHGLQDLIKNTKPTTVKDLVQKGKVETLELNDVDSKNLKRELNSYGVKFSIKKNLTNGNNIIFFQAKDEKVMEQAFKNAV